MRYQGQEHTVNVPFSTHTLKGDDVETILEQFGAVHHQQYGHSMNDPVEIVTLRLRTVGRLQRPALPTIAQGNGNAESQNAGRHTILVSREQANSHSDFAVSIDRLGLLPGRGCTEFIPRGPGPL